VDNQHRVLLYSIATGEAKKKWFGDRPQISIDGQFLALENGLGHLRVFDLKTLKLANEYFFLGAHRYKNILSRRYASARAFE
jgi:hypothetical protein